MGRGTTKQNRLPKFRERKVDYVDEGKPQEESKSSGMLRKVN